MPKALFPPRLKGVALIALALAASPAMLLGCAPMPAITQRGGPLPDFAVLADQVLPAVVSIAVTSRQTLQIPPELRGTPYERLFRDRFRGLPIQGAGSGFVVDPSGIIVTANHVVGNASRVVVSLRDGTELPARVIGSDELTDLALIKVESPAPLPTVPWGGSSALRVGQWVLAAGNPFGLGGSVSSGIVSALGRQIGTGPFDDFIQTDAPINPGNSGGPLFNTAGEVVGINTAIFSPSGASAGIGFAVPSDLARSVVDQLLRGGSIERGWLGVSVTDVPAGENGRRGGALVAEVVRGSPAAGAGLRQGDVVVAVDGQPVEDSRALVRGVALAPPGRPLRLTLLRGGRQTEVTVRTGVRPNQS